MQLRRGIPLTPEVRTDHPAQWSSSWLDGSVAQGLVDPVSGYRTVMSRRRIERGDVVAVFGGVVVSGAQLAALGPDAASRSLQVEEDLYLYSTVDGPADWINHSCAPNLQLRGQIVLVARDVIEPGEELTFDYATADASAFDEFECRCGAPECRRRVTGGDWAVARPEVDESPYISARRRAGHVPAMIAFLRRR